MDDGRPDRAERVLAPGRRADAPVLPIRARDINLTEGLAPPAPVRAQQRLALVGGREGPGPRRAELALPLAVLPVLPVGGLRDKTVIRVDDGNGEEEGERAALCGAREAQGTQRLARVGPGKLVTTRTRYSMGWVFDPT